MERRTRINRRGKVVALTITVAVGLGGVAYAGDEDVVNSKVTLEVKRDVRFKGKVKSPASDCAIGRKVLLYRARGDRDRKVAKAFTSETGKYAVKIPMQQGNKIYALIKRLRTPIDTICKRDRSAVVRV